MLGSGAETNAVQLATAGGGDARDVHAIVCTGVCARHVCTACRPAASHANARSRPSAHKP